MTTYEYITNTAKNFATQNGLEVRETVYVYTCADSLRVRISKKGRFPSVEKYWKQILNRATYAIKAKMFED